jgi:hypothetical protein
MVAAPSPPIETEEAAALSTHQRVRPTWLCGTCALAWPCPEGRAELALEFQDAHLSLMLYLSAHFVDACDDLLDEPAGSLYARFMSWPATSPADI